MTPGFIPALARRRWGQVVMHLVVAGFLIYCGNTLVRASFPMPPGWAKPYPWGMFKSPSSRSKTLRVYGETAGGERVKIDPRKYYHFTRGATDLRFYDHSNVLGKRGYRAQQETEAFAKSLAKQAEREGHKLVNITLEWERVSVYNHKKRKTEPIIHLELTSEAE